MNAAQVRSLKETVNSGVKVKRQMEETGLFEGGLLIFLMELLTHIGKEGDNEGEVKV